MSMRLQFVPLEDPILHTPVGPYTGNVRRLRPLAMAMLDKMRRAGGIGLAAPQVGYAVRMFVMGMARGMTYVCVNPVLLGTSGKPVTTEEGCLTLPGQLRKVERPQTAVVEWTDLYGQKCGRKLTGYLAVCFQHELDHLNGITIYDGDV